MKLRPCWKKRLNLKHGIRSRWPMPGAAAALLGRAELVHKDPEFEVIDVPQLPLPYKKGQGGTQG
jgi:hypothetical protein